MDGDYVHNINIDDLLNQYIKNDFKTGWDYLQWKSGALSDVMVQDDWNQTLITKLNQISAQIFQDLTRGDLKPLLRTGGADTILVHPNIVSEIILSFMYFTPNIKDKDLNIIPNYNNLDIVGEISGRYIVLASYDCEEDSVYVFNRHHNNNGGKIKILNFNK